MGEWLFGSLAGLCAALTSLSVYEAYALGTRRAPSVTSVVRGADYHGYAHWVVMAACALCLLIGHLMRY